jgi:cell wall assembly regulator SMI1
MLNKWSEIEEVLTSLGCIENMRLRNGADPEVLELLEEHLGVTLPESLKEFLKVHDGQERGPGFAESGYFLSVEGIRSNWDMWRGIDEEEMNKDCADLMASAPEGFIRPMYTNRRWVPLTSDDGGNHVGLDFDPAELGGLGQIIVFGRDEDTKRLLASSFEDYVELLLSWLKSAKWNGKYLE